LDSPILSLRRNVLPKTLPPRDRISDARTPGVSSIPAQQSPESAIARGGAVGARFVSPAELMNMMPELVEGGGLTTALGE